MRGYPPCSKCGDSWHGLTCTVTKPTYPGGVRTICGCPSPYDDDYWNGGDQ